MADLVARKVGEGFDKPNAEQELPLDINYQKLIDWLVTRQKLAKDWNKRLQAIHAKAAEAMKDAPAEVHRDSPLDYFRAVEIRDGLSAKCEKTMFGGLTGQAAVWDKIVKAYENNGVFLGEAAQNMVQNADYEIPFLRKQGTRMDQQVKDSQRKADEYARSAGQCAATFRAECKQLGIDSSVIRAGLRSLGEQLPQCFETVLERLESSDLGSACSYFRAFSEYAHGSASTQDMMSTLLEVRDGNTTLPASLMSDPVAQLDSAEAGPKASIDWGIDLDLGGDPPAMEVASSGINWDMDVGGGDVGAAPAEISWDFDMGAADESCPAGTAVEVDWGGLGDASGAAPGSSEPTVDWGIDMSDTGAAASSAAPAIVWDIDDEPQVDQTDTGHGPAAGSARDAQAGGISGRGAAVLRLERDAEYRSRLLDDVQELRAFLVQRKAELRSSGTELLSVLLPEAVQSVDASMVSRYLAAVETALAALTSVKLRRLLMIKTSKRYFDRLACSLERKAGQESRLLAAAQEAETRKREAQASLAALAPRLTDLVSRTRAIKAGSERSLSAAFGGRRVNVLGDINTVLSSTCL